MPMAARYLTVDGEILAEKRNTAKRDYLPDPLGSTAALLDSSQSKTDTFTYWPYGETKTVTNPTGTPFQFVGTLGYYTDASSHQVYVRARIEIPRLGRWLTVDPLWPGEEAYQYAEANPASLIDPGGAKPNKRKGKKRGRGRPKPKPGGKPTGGSLTKPKPRGQGIVTLLANPDFWSCIGATVAGGGIPTPKPGQLPPQGCVECCGTAFTLGGSALGTVFGLPYVGGISGAILSQFICEDLCRCLFDPTYPCPANEGRRMGMGSSGGGSKMPCI